MNNPFQFAIAPFRNFNESEYEAEFKTFDTNKIIAANRYWGKTLGWISRYNDIATHLLGYTTMTPGEALFAQAVALWQKRNGLDNDGTLGPKTWAKMRPLLPAPKPPTSTTPPKPSLPPVAPPPPNAGTLRWGVPGGVISSPWIRNREDYRQQHGRYPNRTEHLGIDVSLPTPAKAGTADDPRRGVAVYATVKTQIPLAVLNSVGVVEQNKKLRTGLGIAGSGQATLKNALVRVQPWDPRAQKSGSAVINSWGGIVGLACRYNYQRFDGKQGVFTVYLEYLHLIAENFPPVNQFGNKFMTTAQWVALGRNAGFGPLMQNNAVLLPHHFTASPPPLIGYLGATYGPHVHIHANYEDGEKGYKFFPRFDPTVMIY